MDEKIKVELLKMTEFLNKDLSLENPDMYFIETILESMLKTIKKEIKIQKFIKEIKK